MTKESRIPISGEYEIVIRVEALKERGVTREQILSCMKCQEPRAESNSLWLFGPHFGAEAANEFVARLGDLGLKYWVDYIEVDLSIPTWFKLFAKWDKSYGRSHERTRFSLLGISCQPRFATDMQPGFA